MNDIVNFNDMIKKSFVKLDVFAKVSIIDVLICMLMTFIVGMFIFYIYKRTFRGVIYNYNYNVALVAMCLITSLVIMTISSNVILSLGMVGALSIVRFRTAVKDPMDIVFMFWSIAAGIASGAGIYPISIFGSLLIGLILVILFKRSSNDCVYLLIIHYNENANDGVRHALNRLKKYTIKSKTVSNGNVELTLEVKLKSDNTAFVNRISSIEGVIDAALVSYNREYAA